MSDALSTGARPQQGLTAPLRVLYAEDSAADADLTRAAFAPYEDAMALQIVHSGSACLDALQSREYDVLLLDNHLPDIDATDLLKSAPTLTTVPVVVVTSVGDEELVVRLLRLGAWDYVPKTGEYLDTLPDVLRRAVLDFRRQPERRVQRARRRVVYAERHAGDIDLTSAHFAQHAEHLILQPVRSSQAALDLIAEGGHDLLLIDLRMPDLGALDVLREARRRGIDVPVVIVTGRGDEEAAAAALRLGASDYIVKRDDYLLHLPHAIDRAVGRFELEQANRQLAAELAERARAEQERARLDEELRQAQKIDSLGRLAGGIAHDFNNLLTVIQGHADLMLHDLRDGDPLRDSVADVAAAAKRAADLTRQLLAFGRRQLRRPRVLDLNAAIVESTRMLRRLLGEDITLETTLDPLLAPVRADPGQLDQVIVNLAINARDAMPAGGRLTIETRNVSVSDADVRRHPSFRAGAFVLLTLRDTGVGMPTEVLAQIFEPFFTTKEQGKGTGLGLSTVHGIVQQSDGWITVESEQGRGTIFRIYLPQSERPVRAVEAAAPAAEQRGRELVLVVEDEESVRRLTCHALRRHGYEVLEAANGGEALLLCERRPQAIPLLITDVVMPGMSGPQLAERLRQIHPEMRVLFTSGYTDAAVVRHGLLNESLAFLQKPFTPNDLGRKVRETLDAPPPRP